MLCSVFKENDWYGTWVLESVILRVGEDDVSEMFNVVPPHWRLEVGSVRQFDSFSQGEKSEGKENTSLQMGGR